MVVGVALLIALVTLSFLAPVLAPYDPRDVQFTAHQPPSLKHPFGTDRLGRDVLTRILSGTRISLGFAVGAAALSLVVGALLGAVAGYALGLIDEVITKTFDIVIMLPRLLVLILAVMLFGSSLWTTMLLVGLTMAPVTGRIMRGQVLSLREREYVVAARALGATDWRIPNGMPPVASTITLQASNAIILEAGLSFLGLGDRNIITLGQMLNSAQAYVQTAWWPVFFPGLAIALLVVGFHMIGEDLEAPAARRAASLHS
jgi:peptide/nickel transport system permease protein